MSLRKFGASAALATTVFLAWTGVALAQTSAATCKLNGQDVPCDQLGKTVGAAVGFGIGFILLMVALGIAASVFWLMMLIHAATHPIQNRPMWILLMVFTGIVGATIYYFTVERALKP